MSATARMRAERFHNYGGPEVLHLEEVPLPEPGQRELLVRVHAAGVNPVDWKVRAGKLGQTPLPSIMGYDFSGVVEALGPDVESFRVGMEVFGTVGSNSGSYAEYAVAPTRQVTEKPKGLDHITAAALPIASLTAWQALFDQARLQPGQRVLVHAAAGGVGGFAVQLAKWKGATVVGTASTHHHDYVKALGADQVIDYRRTRFEHVVGEVNVVLDTIGGETQRRSWSVLKPGGVLVSIVDPPGDQDEFSRGVRGIFLYCDHRRADQLSEIGDLVAAGRIRVNVNRVFTLSEAPHAHELSQSGHTTGKLVLRIA